MFRTKKPLRLGRILLALLASLILSACLTWHFRAPLLTRLASAWTVTCTPAPSDAIVILGGGINTRPFEAVELFHQKLAPRILIAETAHNPASAIGIVSRETDHSRQILLHLGVPPEAIETFGRDVTSTHEEATALRAWVLTHSASSLIIPTDFLHTRRVAWLMRRVLPPHLTIHTVATPAVRYDMNNWWQREEGLVSFQNELVKSLYYRLKF